MHTPNLLRLTTLSLADAGAGIPESWLARLEPLEGISLADLPV